MENVAFGKMHFLFEIKGAHRFDTGISIAITCETIFDRITAELVDAGEVAGENFVADPVIIFFK